MTTLNNYNIKLNENDSVLEMIDIINKMEINCEYTIVNFRYFKKIKISYKDGLYNWEFTNDKNRTYYSSDSQWNVRYFKTLNGVKKAFIKRIS